jgi:SAM-dependent methyltransferase
MQWRWPKKWPFPADFLEVVPLKFEDYSPLTDEALGVFRRFLNQKIPFETSAQKTVEIGELQLKLLSERESFVELSKLDNCKIPLGTCELDTVVISGGIESSVDPRTLFREIWRVLRPGGICFVCFSGKNYVPITQALKMWTTMNDEQKIWYVKGISAQTEEIIASYIARRFVMVHDFVRSG